MRAITLFVLLGARQFCFAGEETNIVAMSEWSTPVASSDGQTLRGRMLIAQEHSLAHRVAWPETAFYLELQNVSGAVGAPMQIYFDPGRSLQCEVLDSYGKPPPSVGGAGSGAGINACWITLPHGSTIRLRANMYGYGRKPGDGFLIQMSPPSRQRWDIQSGDPNAYFMSGTLTVTAPLDHVARNFDATRSIWTGTLELPKMNLLLPKP
ncbi:MAG TPA: hypothetical protein VFG14_12495 [Chthoniobacteraceae bacterium]|nr:hypothetical protein [Chthoniobacteraceae bacterium]